MRTTAVSTGALALALAGVAIAKSEKVEVDALYSSRLSKRGLDEEGNFNICMFRPCRVFLLCSVFRVLFKLLTRE